MKKDFLRKEMNANQYSEGTNLEDFTEIQSIVDNLLSAMEQTKKEQSKSKKNKVRKKWQKPKPKKMTLEDLGIRDLPFTF
jgi:hypothetical protein